jgi:hypothetical protein
MSLLKGLQAIWRGSKLEVESVLREVCDRVLTDPLVPRETLKYRAVGLKIIGTIYMKVKSDVTPEDIPIPITPPLSVNNAAPPNTSGGDRTSTSSNNGKPTTTATA